MEELKDYSYLELLLLRDAFLKEHKHKIKPPYLDDLLAKAYAPYGNYHSQIVNEIKHREDGFF